MQQVLLVALWIGAGAVFRQPVVLAHQLGQQGGAWVSRVDSSGRLSSSVASSPMNWRRRSRRRMDDMRGFTPGSSGGTVANAFLFLKCILNLS
ncbi:hypothetical protein C531_21760 [Pseudomonas aeruginosa SD9]|nr:hypothetical protein C531_21760 [Pseudomonas aeruginosa SD9]